MRVLLVGLGRWGEQHLRVWRSLGATVWVAEPGPDRRAVARAAGVAEARIVPEPRAALDAVDAVDVVTPADSHAALAGTALAAGRHCLVEKPLAVTVAEGRRVARAAARAGRVLQVGHVFRFHPVTATLRAALGEDRIGRVRFLSGRFAGFKRPRTDVGVTHTDAIHWADLFAHLLGRPARRVSALQRDVLGRGLDDLAVLTLDYGDAAAVIEANYFAPGVQRECVVMGERGSLVADYVLGTVTLHRGAHRRRGEGWEPVDEGKEPLAVAGEEPLRAELHAFGEACAGRGPNLVPAADGLHALAVVEAAARAARSGRAVRVAGG